MNNDIVDRLRVKDGIYTEFWQQRLMDEAADEIVRLRARVTELEYGMFEYDELHDLYLLRRRKHNEEAALADQLAEALRLVDNDSYMLPIESDEAVTAALAAYEAARRETP